MIAADASSISAYLMGEQGRDVEVLDDAFKSGALTLPPVTVTELYSDPTSADWADQELGKFPLLAITPGYWRRAGLSRQLLIRRGLKAKVAATLAAQACIDNDVTLIARDPDFRHFAKHCGLKLA
jgi:predicted nucleic acid-binding protein